MLMQAIFNSYKPDLLKLLQSYCSDNKDKIDVSTVIEPAKVTCTITLDRSLFTCDKSYNEIIDTLRSIGEVKTDA